MFLGRLGNRVLLPSAKIFGAVASCAAALSVSAICWASFASENLISPHEHHGHAYLHNSSSNPKIFEAEQQLLRTHVHRSQLEHLPVYIEPAPDSLLRQLIVLPNESEGSEGSRDHQLYMHGFRATQAGASAGETSAKPILVLMHGWSSGSALWAKIIDNLTPTFDVYAFDLLGFGQSSRPRFLGSNPADARSFWLESFDLWREQTLPPGAKFSLVGHSLGGFLACAWAADGGHEHLDSLYLAAPVGIAPWSLTIETPLRRFLAHLVWDWGVTPQGLLRAMGPFSERFWSSLGERARYRELDEDGWKYLGHLQVLPGSGDKAFMKLLERTGWGDPLLARLDQIHCPTRIIYGEHDYVRHDFGPVAVKEMSNSPFADYTIINNVGHHMYWRESDAFARSISHFHKRVVESGVRRTQTE